jgi:hypothetical protein
MTAFYFCSLVLLVVVGPVLSSLSLLQPLKNPGKKSRLHVAGTRHFSFISSF